MTGLQRIMLAALAGALLAAAARLPGGIVRGLAGLSGLIALALLAAAIAERRERAPRTMTPGERIDGQSCATCVDWRGAADAPSARCAMHACHVTRDGACDDWMPGGAWQPCGAWQSCDD